MNRLCAVTLLFVSLFFAGCSKNPEVPAPPELNVKQLLHALPVNIDGEEVFLAAEDISDLVVSDMMPGYEFKQGSVAVAFNVDVADTLYFVKGILAFEFKDNEYSSGNFEPDEISEIE